MKNSKDEYKINDLITLKLIDDKTILFVKEKPFNQCKYLLFFNPQEDHRQWEINSIDEAAEILVSNLEKNYNPEDLGISPQEEFWGHCSNLQAWAENNYDTNLLHSNLAFPLLRKLLPYGDLMAKKVYLEEIAKRFESGYLPVILYLWVKRFLYDLPDEYFYDSVHSEKFIKILMDSIKHKDKLIKELSLYLFYRSYSCLSEELVCRFIEHIKEDVKYFNKMLFLMYANTKHINPGFLYPIRLAIAISLLNNRDYNKYEYDKDSLIEFLKENLGFKLKNPYLLNLHIKLLKKERIGNVICNDCNKRYHDGIKFCRICGKPLRKSS